MKNPEMDFSKVNNVSLRLSKIESIYESKEYLDKKFRNGPF